MLFWETVGKQLESKGFREVKQKENWYWRAENPVLYLLCLLDGATAEPREEIAAFLEFAQQMESRLKEFCCTRLVALTVLVDKMGEFFPVDFVESGDISYDKDFYTVFWQFSSETGKVTAEKGQPDRLLGIEKLLLAAAKGENPETLPLRRQEEQEKPVVTAGIFIICAVLLAVTVLSGRRDEILLAAGLSREGILAGEYYRFLTSIFLHAGLLHLISNGIYLYYFGIRAERLLGKARFLLLYLVSGLCGGMCSVLFGAGGISIGASGAIYGLLGAMLLLTKKRGPADTGMSYSTMLLLAVTAICLGFLEPGVDNMAHIGGFLGGVAVFWLFLRKKSGKIEDN